MYCIGALCMEPSGFTEFTVYDDTLRGLTANQVNPQTPKPLNIRKLRFTSPAAESCGCCPAPAAGAHGGASKRPPVRQLLLVGVLLLGCLMISLGCMLSSYWGVLFGFRK